MNHFMTAIMQHWGIGEVEFVAQLGEGKTSENKIFCGGSLETEHTLSSLYCEHANLLNTPSAAGIHQCFANK